MPRSADISELTALIEPLVQAKGYSLVEVSFGTAFRRRTLTVYIDKPGGVQVADCQALAHEIGDFLEQQAAMNGSYVLEVSSPGAERPLKTDRDFLHFQGRYALIRTKELIPALGKDEVFGFLQGLGEGTVLLRTEQGEQLEIKRADITKARLAIKF